MSVESQLKSMTPIFISVFCLLAAERLLSIYEAFAKRYSLSFEGFRTVVNGAYELVFDLNKYKLEGLKNELKKFIPDTDDFSDVLADQAQCAAICLMYVLEYMSDNDSLMVGYVFQKLDESIDIVGYEGGNERDISHSEEVWKYELLKKLGEASEIDMWHIESLRKLNFEHAIPHV